MTPLQPPLSELLTRYLNRQIDAHGAGLGLADVAGDVVPFEAVPVQPVDARLAWEEAVSVARWFVPDVQTKNWDVASDWASLVSAQEPMASVAFCFGNFPQLVRNLQPLMETGELSALQPFARPVLATGVIPATERSPRQSAPQILLAAAMLRLTRHFDEATELLRSNQTQLSGAWVPALENERAAIAWHRGEVQVAADLWRSQKASVPVLFNRGMSALFMDKPDETRPLLQQAVAQLGEDDAWYHLGRLYLALAEIRSS